MSPELIIALNDERAEHRSKCDQTRESILQPLRKNPKIFIELSQLADPTAPLETFCKATKDSPQLVEGIKCLAFLQLCDLGISISELVQEEAAAKSESS